MKTVVERLAEQACLNDHTLLDNPLECRQCGGIENALHLALREAARTAREWKPYEQLDASGKPLWVIGRDYDGLMVAGAVIAVDRFVSAIEALALTCRKAGW